MTVQREMTGFERGTLRWAKVAVFMSALAALFVCLQWYEMHQGGVDTHALADAAIDQADAAQQFSDTAEDINNRMSDAVDQLTTTTDNVKASIQATQEAMRLDQRAWLGIWHTYILPADQTGTIKIQIEIVNTGKTPAIRVSKGLPDLFGPSQF
jgi:hypothetical protein